MLRLQPADLSMQNTFTDYGMAYLAQLWTCGVFNCVEEFSIRGRARSAPWQHVQALLWNWRQAPPEALANLQVRQLSLTFIGSFSPAD